MTTILGIETATVEVSVALVDDEGVIASFTARGLRRQVETLHPAITSLLDAAGMGLSDLDAVAVDIGPGRFTGLRVGVAAAKALGFALDVPLVGATSIEILTRGVTGAERPVVPVIDMRRGEVAFATPGWPGGEEHLELTAPDELGRRLQVRGLTGALLVGDGALRFAPEIAQAAGTALLIAGDEHLAPSAAMLARLGLERMALGETTDAIALAPMYLRGADVRIGWENAPDTAPAGADGLATSAGR